MGGGKYLQKDMRVIGKNNFTKTFLRTGIQSIEEADFWEGFYVEILQCTDPEIGYNRRNGGRKASFKHTQDSINKITVRSQQPDNRKRIREIQKLASQKRIGCHQTKEAKQKMVRTRFGKNRSIEIYRDGIIVHTCGFQKEAALLTDVKRSAISNNLCGLSKSAGGFTFKYKEV